MKLVYNDDHLLLRHNIHTATFSRTLFLKKSTGKCREPLTPHNLQALFSKLLKHKFNLFLERQANECHNLYFRQHNYDLIILKSVLL